MNMACKTCTSLESIPTCTDELLLGTIDADAEVYIYVLNETTGYTHKQEAVSSGSGDLNLNLEQPDPSFYNPNSTYEVWVTLRTDNVRLSISIGGDDDTCLAPLFYLVGDTYEIPAP